MATRITVRRDTLANFLSARVIPANGEPIGITDSTGIVTAYKIGDGSSPVDQLPALSKGDQGPRGLPGANAVENDAAFAAALATPGTATRNAAEGLVSEGGSVTQFTVARQGASFVSPKVANDSITDSSSSRRFISRISSGVYSDTYDWTPAPFTTQRGVNRETTVLSYVVPVDSPDQPIIDRSTLLLHGTAALEDLTVVVEGGRYAVHSEQSGVNQDAVHTVRNCRFVHRGHDAINAWRTAHPESGLTPKVFNSMTPWGVGGASGLVEAFEDSVFDSPYSPFYGHNNQQFTAPMRSTFTRCTFTTKSANASVATINSLGSGTADAYTFTDCEFNGTYIYHTDTSWMVDTYANHIDFAITVDRGNPVGFYDDSRGLALQVTSGFGDPGVLGKVTVGGTAAPIIFGDAPIYRDGTGDAGFLPIGIGTVDISGITLGFDGHAGSNTLGKKLGNRTGAPIQLVVANQGGYAQAYTFNADYSAMTNQQIIDLVNTSWNGFVLSTVNPAAEYYPKMLGKERRLVNAGTGIAQYTSVAYADGGKFTVRPFATGDDISIFAGIALARIPAGASGRILTEGVMRKTQLTGLSGATVNPGTQVYMDAANAGRFATAGTKLVGAGRAADWVYFRAPSL